VDVDVAVIGTGVAGAWTATLCADGGLKVAIVDRREYGGTCKLRGCDPKRILLEVSRAVCSARALYGKGIEGDIRIDWASLMARKREHVASVPAKTEEGLRQAGVAILEGTARFVAPGALDVEGERLRAADIVIATGARPRPLDIPGADLAIDSEGFLDLDPLPEHLVFVGGGYIAFEFAGLARCAGAEVTVIEAAPRALSGFDHDVVERLVAAYREMGITILVDAPVLSLERRGGAVVVHTERGDVKADLAVHGAGRIPDLDALDLEAAGVKRSRQGVVVEETLRSVSEPHVHAVGDAADRGLPLTPVASREAEALARTLLGKPTVWDPRATATVVFSVPPVGSVGMSAAEAAERDDVEVLFTDTSEWFSQQRAGVSHACAKVMREKDGGRLLGATLIGHGADELINLFALAVRAGLTAEQVEDAVYAYPTVGTDVGYLVST